VEESNNIFLTVYWQIEGEKTRVEGKLKLLKENEKNQEMSKGFGGQGKGKGAKGFNCNCPWSEKRGGRH